MRALKALAFGALVAACAGPGAPSPSIVSGSPSPSMPASPAPSPTAEASLAPTAEPQETERTASRRWADPPPTPLLLYRAVRVVVDELNIRYEPSTSARRLGAARAGDVLAVILYPTVGSDGYVWQYGVTVAGDGELPPLPRDPFDVQDGIGGWFAVGTGEIEYVEPLGPRCPETVTLETLGAMLGAERVACFGDDAIEFKGTLQPPPGVPPEIFGEFTPQWLADPNIVNAVTTGPDSPIGLNLRVPPSIAERPPAGAIIRVQGHFDDPRADKCDVAPDPPWGNINPRPAPYSFAQYWCRQMFVVDAWSLAGS